MALEGFYDICGGAEQVWSSCGGCGGLGRGGARELGRAWVALARGLLVTSASGSLETRTFTSPSRTFIY
jgi:hypothetical protein